MDRTQYGGTYALNGDREKAMEQAEKGMAAHCGPGNYTIVREGEVPVGTDTAARTDTYNNTNGSQTQTAGESTRTATEWRVQYQCGQGAPPPAAVPPGGQPPPGGPPPPPPADPGQPPAPGY